MLGKGLKSLNKELSGWIRGLITELLKYKMQSIKAGVGYTSIDARYTSKYCHICGNIGRRGAIIRGKFLEKGYGLAFSCSNPFCEGHNLVINADLNAARNICH